MHNNIMAAGSKDHPPMLGPGRYSQWRSRFLRYIDTKGNGKYLRKCIFEGPYKLTSVVIEAVGATVNSPKVPQHDKAETVHNMSAENKLYFQAKKEAIFLLLAGIRDEIYSTVDAYNTANEMWIAIERLQQGESLNIQDVKTNLFWEFKKFTSQDGESMESYYSRFYKLMNELTRNNLQVTTMQQFQLEDTYIKQPKPQRSNATSSPTRQLILNNAQTRQECKKNLALLAMYFIEALQSYQQQPSLFGESMTMTVAGARKQKAVRLVQTDWDTVLLPARDLGTMQRNAEANAALKTYAYQ
ncbi:hypothetical protein Tco_0153035 [Tanacetum coccineum]